MKAIATAWLRTPEFWLLAIGTTFLICNLAFSAEPVTLDQAIAEAKAKSPVYRQAEAAYKEASWQPLEALSGNLPHLSIAATHFFDLKYQIMDVAFGGQTVSVPAIIPQTLLSLDASWIVFDGLQTPRNYAAARKNAHAAELELERAGFSLEEQVRISFYKALAAQLLADVAQQNVTTLQDHLDKAKDILSEGSSTKFDVLRVQTQLEEAIPEKKAADDDVILARRALATTMGLMDDSRPVTGELPIPRQEQVPADLKLDISSRTDIEALQERADAAESVHSGSFGTWFPKIGLMAEQQYYNNLNFDLNDSYRTAYSVGVQLIWNLFDGGASISRQFQTAYQRDRAEANSEQSALQAANDFEQYRRRFGYNVELYNAKRRAIETAEESVRLAKLGYSAGTRTSTDVLDAELDLFRARAGLVQAQVDGAVALINLELALGRKI